MLIDLSQPLTDRMPVYPGDPPVTVEQVSRFPEAPWQLTRISLGCHAGTHVDAPRHFLPLGATLEQLPLERFCGPARLARLRPDTDGRLDACGLSAADVPPGTCLLLHTGWRPMPGQPLSECPVFTPGSGRHLAGLGIRLLALDLPTVESAAESEADDGESEAESEADDGESEADDGTMHRILLEAGIVIVENLANLDALADALACRAARGNANGQAFGFFAVPLLIPGGEASPVRAFAELDD